MEIKISSSIFEFQFSLFMKSSVLRTFLFTSAGAGWCEGGWEANMCESFLFLRQPYSNAGH